MEEIETPKVNELKTPEKPVVDPKVESLQVKKRPKKLTKKVDSVVKIDLDKNKENMAKKRKYYSGPVLGNSDPKPWKDVNTNRGSNTFTDEFEDGRTLFITSADYGKQTSARCRCYSCSG